uniref:RNA helicase n=1 Tax=Oryzias latipes TaxID=8090 RepID=A0A3P9KYN0_ORYLA
MSSLKQSLHFGLEFVAFLGDRINGINEIELGRIYDNNFKQRDGIKRPNFYKIFYALLEFNKIYIDHNGNLYSSSGALGRRPRASHPNPSRCDRPAAEQQALLSDPKSLAVEIIQRMRVNRKEMLADKGGIIITSDPMISNGKVQVSVDLGKKHHVIGFHIVNRSPSCINFTYYTAISRIHHPSLEDERKVSRVNPVLLCSEESYDVVVHYKLDQYGYFPATVFFEFQPDVPKASPFYIVREIEVSVETPLDSKLGPVSPYKPFQKVTRRPVGWLVKERVPPVNLFYQKVPTKGKLREYNCPRYLKKLVKHKMEDSELLSSLDRKRLASVKKCLDSSSDMENYSRRFHLLLHLEEIRMEADIRKYDLQDQTMSLDQHNRNLFVLEVPGLAENRPSVLRGDCLRVTRSDDTAAEITVYEGRVHKIEQNKLLLGFYETFVKNFISKMKFNVEFTFNRRTLKLQHRAVDLATKHQLGDVLFPSGAAKSSLSLPKLSMFNHHLNNNPEQLKAVQHIVAGSSQPAPYVVFGPPGTGKTVTLVEAINQILKLNSSARILACAPTNSACDVLCELLLSSCCSYQVYRMYAQSRDPASVSTALRKHCNIDEKQDCFSLPKTGDLMTFRVIVTTLYTAGRLVRDGEPVNHFSHVFVDEAGQGLESETVIAIAGLLSPQEGQLVLAGDPKQLGPIVHSPIASKHQLGLSLLERLMDYNDLYKTSNPRFVTTLQRNYRSHEAILKIPNEEFYGGKLQVFADKKEREAFCSWDGLGTKGFPVIFHGVMGKDEREQNSPSFFNVTEINILFKYLKQLLDDQGKKGLPEISAEDIGIIAPYRKQVEKIRLGLKDDRELSQKLDLTHLKVGSVEEFQGQEKKIIMISTVRSTSSYVKMDQDFNTGFLSNDKRFNVAITRAKSLLIVVGNPLILRSHPVWKKFIDYCLAMKGYTGFPLEDTDEIALVQMMASLRILDTEC